MRIVAVADTHTFHGELLIPAGDVFVHAGDMCRGGDLDELAENARWIRGLPHRWKVVIAGNHDWSFVHAPAESRALFAASDVVYLQDSGAELDGLRVWGSPWQPAFNDWAFNLPRGEALAQRWRLIPAGLHMLITHGPPAGFGDRSPVGGRAGCADLHARIAEVSPRAHVFGHIHQDGGVFDDGIVTYVNATTWECERQPTVFDLDLASGVVTPISVPPHGRSEDVDGW